MSGTSLFERMGGESAIMAAVDLFYEKVIADPVTRDFFTDQDMDAQSRKLVGFMAWAFGGPSKYKGRNLREAHALLVRDRGLSDVHFDAVAVHLKTTLEEMNVDRSLVDEALGIIADTRIEVLSR